MAGYVRELRKLTGPQPENEIILDSADEISIIMNKIQKILC